MHLVILKRYFDHSSETAGHALYLCPQNKHRHRYHNSTFGSVHYLGYPSRNPQQESTKAHLLHHDHRHCYQCFIVRASILQNVSVFLLAMSRCDCLGRGRGCRSCVHLPLPDLHQNILISALSTTATPGRHSDTTLLSISPILRPLLLLLLLPLHSFFTTSFSPIRISGHILCSYSQVSEQFRTPHSTG